MSDKMNTLPILDPNSGFGISVQSPQPQLVGIDISPVPVSAEYKQQLDNLVKDTNNELLPQ